MMAFMNEESTPKSLPTGHVAVPALAIGSLSMVLVAGLGILGIPDRANLLVSNLVSRHGTEDFPKAVPEWLVWMMAVVFGFGIAFSILGTAGNWRRIMLLLTALVVVGGWAPVLGLAAHFPAVAAPWIATLWSGICALVYARNHRMACDDAAEEPPTVIPHEAR